MRIWVNPEIERRRECGVLPADFRLHACQVIFPSPLDAAAARRVHLNEEVRIVLTVRTNRTLRPGEVVTEADVEAIESARLPPSEGNSGHITLLHLGDAWFLAFDCRYNKTRVKEHLVAAREFLAAAAHALSDSKLRPACDLLFSAAELLAKAQLLPIPQKGLKTHRSISARLNAWVRLGNMPELTKTHLDHLGALRESARYLERPLKVTRSRLEAVITDLESEAARIEQGLER